MRALWVAILVGCGGHDAPPVAPPAAPGNLELAPPLLEPKLSHDGRYAVFANDVSPPCTYVVVDTTTHAMLVREHITQLEVAPDHRLISVADNQLAIHDLVTGAQIAGPLPIVSAFVLSEDGKLAWGERLGGEYRIHLRTLATGAEKLLLDTPFDVEWGLSIAFDGRGHVVASTARALRAWDEDHPDPIFIEDAPLTNETLINTDGITYKLRDDERLYHVDLSPGTRTLTRFATDKVCGEAEADGFVRCDEDRYMTRRNGHLCVWNTKTGRVQARIADSGDDFHCNAKTAWVREMPTFGEYTWYSVATGKQIPSQSEHHTGGIIYGPYDAQAGFDADELREPTGDVVANTTYGRAELLSKSGQLRWQGPAPSHVMAMAFTSHNELVAAGEMGELWRVDLASRELHASQIAECKLENGDAIAIAPDGRAGLPCVRGNTRAMMLEGKREPLFVGNQFDGWLQATATSTTAATYGWVLRESYAWSFPDGQPRWSYPDDGLGLAVTADGARFAAGRPIAIRDAANRVVASVESEGRPLAFSPGGSYLAIAEKDKLVIADAKTGAKLDETTAGAPLVAWDPSGAPRFAYWRVRPAGIAIRDLRLQRDVESRSPIAGTIKAIAWPDANRIAVLADHRVTLWEASAAPTTFAFAGQGGVELRADRRAVLLGDPKAARGLVMCVRGNLRYAEGCEDSFSAAPRAAPL